MTPEQFEEQLARAAKAPRVTREMMEAAIESEHYFSAEQGARAALGHTVRLEDVGHGPAVHSVAWAEVPAPLKLVTICCLVLRNGFTIVASSAPASPENFDAQIGREIARQKAVEQLWPLLGFALREQLHHDQH